MKKSSFLVLAAAGIMLTACADKDVMVFEDSTPQEELRSEGFMALDINLPTTPTTRAENDVFDHGEGYEYQINDCALLLFQGAANEKEEEAKLINAQAILLPDGIDGDSEDNITTTYTAVAKVNNFDNNGTNRLYALVFLNYRNIMSIDVESGIPTIAGTKLGTGTTFADIQKLQTTADLFLRNEEAYFFMANAVLSKAKGGYADAAPEAADVFQLAEMDCRKIKENKADAEKDPAGEIFVERAVAKATLDYAADAWKLYKDQMEIASVEWAIDNMEPITYVVRNPGESEYIGYTSGYFTWGGRNPNYRFVGAATLYGGTTLGKPGTDDIYRSYWCIDPQYDQQAVNMVAATKFYPTKKEGAIDDLYPLYCYENTFDVEHQSYTNTTRAIIKVVLKGKDGDELPTFYTVNNGSDYYLNKDDATSYVMDNVIVNTSVVEAFQNSLVANGSYDITQKDFTTVYKRDETTGQLKLETLEIAEATLNNPMFKAAELQAAFDAVKQSVIDIANKSVVIREYQKGVMYYAARFKHFAGSVAGEDDLAPWNRKEGWEGKVAGTKTDIAYPTGADGKTPEENYLGRYGMVRNNWYDIRITDFMKFGYPADPSGQVNNPDFDDPDTSDDNLEEYIAVKIHVLSWAKRFQNWKF